MTNLFIPEPAPIPNNNPAIADLVIADMLERKALGIKEYGVPLQAGNGRDPQQDRYDELIDAVFYLKQEMEDNKLFEIYSLLVKLPIDDSELILVEAIFLNGKGENSLDKKWRIKSDDMGVVSYYGKDKTYISEKDKDNDQFEDNYCWDNMKEAFLFAQENLIEKPVQETSYSVLGDK